ncbi:MAG: glycosyltransferase [Acidobacteria bacterium]|nr:glycosyltransferase [Acidobacteriota bacterium]
MTPASPGLTFVIPVYNGAAFLRASLDEVWRWLVSRHAPAELLVVDDGSSDATPQVLDDFARWTTGDGRAPGIVFRRLRNAVNRGKGFAVRRAFLHARGRYVVFTDADLTYPVENVAAVVARLEQGADVVLASRMHRDSRYEVAPWFFRKLYTRHLMGRVFNLLVRALVVPDVRDTQAGLKGFGREAAVALAERVRLDRFSFDVELLFVARRLRLSVVDCPVLFLYRKEPSTVRFAHDSFAMLRDMIRIRIRGWRGVYEAGPDRVMLADLEHGGRAAPLRPSPPSSDPAGQIPSSPDGTSDRAETGQWAGMDR